MEVFINLFSLSSYFAYLSKNGFRIFLKNFENGSEEEEGRKNFQ